MNERLYYADAYLRDFEAEVIDCQSRQDGPWLLLDQSAFYPASGGQPYDTGSLQSDGLALEVLDVQTDKEGRVWHRVDKPLTPGTPVQGSIDWTRRFDHMQQHGGEHILAGSLYALYQGYVHGLHVSKDFSTIDVTLPDGRTRLSKEEIAALESLANRRVQLDAPIRCWFPDPQELPGLPLRKEPTVEEHVRIVAAGDFEMVACGGTHPASTGQIGLIKVLDCAPSRGKMRLSFICGMRAIRHYQTLFTVAGEASALLSSPLDALAMAAEHVLDEQALLREKLSELKVKLANALLKDLTAQAQTLPGGIVLFRAVLEDMDMEGLKAAANALVLKESCIALLGAPKEGGFHLLFARHAKLPLDMSALLRSSGAKGGGRPDFAQGSALTADALEKAAGLLIDKLSLA